MRQWLRIVYDTMKVFILFTGCTVLFYYGIIWINQEYQNYHRYDEPEGSSVKVTSMVEEKNDSLLNRLIYFYQNGE
ncbi:YqzK family protein [Fredinandcohnia quinoae]|uniref:YqzK family protein n=1 Tax=Fredinandcohnia quinoae TaxID=2918902 RepID=A0AAW5E245_9BACI|nr:YqzK family protein [Fredinandcohnia sp. SECRCQ15]MCH1624829.1 YqzK family protein [Fredinandcohnia sp. SECRCQ15]